MARSEERELRRNLFAETRVSRRSVKKARRISSRRRRRSAGAVAPSRRECKSIKVGQHFTMKTSNNSRQSNVTREAEFNKENLSLVPANNSTCSGSLDVEQPRNSSALLLGFLNARKLREKIDDDNEQPEEE